MRSLAKLALALLVACGGRGHPTAASPAASPVAPANETEPKLVAVDAYGSSTAINERLVSEHGDELRRFGEALMRHDRTYDRDAAIALVGAAGDFVSIEPALVGYYEDEGMEYYLSIDVVERRDAARRMAFSPAPTGEHADPEGLVADWHTYESRVVELMGAGEMSPARVACPGFHCFGDHEHAAVAALAERFRERVPHQIEALTEIPRDDRREAFRAAAAYLLGYMTDGRELVRRLIPALHDESSFVRNSVMRVLAEIAVVHPEIEIPLEPILEVLDFPATTDRNKAAAILDGLLARPDSSRYQRAIIDRAGATLLAMLRLQQPNNHDYAYEILKKLSGKAFAERDCGAWETWVASVRSPPARIASPRVASRMPRRRRTALRRMARRATPACLDRVALGQTRARGMTRGVLRSLLCTALTACGSRASSESPAVETTCTRESAAVYGRQVPDLRLDHRLEAALGLVRMADMDRCVRTLPESVVGLELTHSVQLARFVDRFGWPTQEAWPPDVVDAAFLLAQHSPDVALQERVLAALSARNDRDPVAARHHALLHDRIHAIRKGLPQRFGTQGRCVGPGHWEPLPIQDPDTVDDRRRAAGLPPLAEYVAEMNQLCVVRYVR